MTTTPIWITVDGEQTEVPRGEMILRAVEAVGVHVPTLCHDSRLTPQGSCGICMIEVRRDVEWRKAPACSTPAQDGAEVRTHSPALETSRRLTLELLFSHHTTAARYYPERRGAKPPLVCACKGHASCALRSLCLDLDAQPDRFDVRADPDPPQSLRDGIELEMSKCIRCDRCVRICREVVGVEALSFVSRGRDTQLVFAEPVSPELLERCNGCVETGALCIDTCPTDALHPPRRGSKLPVV